MKPREMGARASQGRLLFHGLLCQPVGTSTGRRVDDMAVGGEQLGRRLGGGGAPHLGLCSRAAATWACSAPTDNKAMALTVSASSVSPAWASRRERPRPAANLCTQLQCLPVDEGRAVGQGGAETPNRMDFPSPGVHSSFSPLLSKLGPKPLCLSPRTLDLDDFLQRGHCVDVGLLLQDCLVQGLQLAGESSSSLGLGVAVAAPLTTRLSPMTGASIAF